MVRAGRARAIVADDHPKMLAATASLLSNTFDVVAAVPDGAAAAEAAARLRPDVVVLDIAMPRMDGFQTAPRILEVCDARIVFLSNYVGDDYVVAALERGASAFVPKTRLGQDLLAAVGHAVEGRGWVPAASVLPRWTRQSRRHDVQLYASDAFLFHAAVAFFESALERGHAVVAITSQSHQDAIERQLAARGIDVAALVASGRYSRLDAAYSLDCFEASGSVDAAAIAALLDPIVDRALKAATAVPPCVSLFGQVAPILCARGDFESMVRLERIADEYVARRGLSLLCAYSTEALAGRAGDVTAHVCAEHAVIVPAN